MDRRTNGKKGTNSMNSEILKREDCVLVVIDVQEKLARVIEEAPRSIENIVRLVKFSKIVGMPLLVTEQENLGATVSGIRSEIEGFQPIRKISFSCFGCEEFSESLKRLNRRTLVLAGIEAHICVAQTALEAVGDFHVQVVADAVSSRASCNKEVSLKRLRQRGVTITTTEMFIYEILGRAGTEEFRSALKLVK